MKSFSKNLTILTKSQSSTENIDRELGVKNILDLYQDFTPDTWIINDDPREDADHAAFGFLAEAGEVATVYQKYFRGDFEDEEKRKRLKGEIGDCLYYLSQICNIEGFRLAQILVENRDKLIDRHNRNVVKGFGDFR